MTKQITEDIKIRVTPEQSKIVQETLFKMGYKWNSGDNYVKFIDMFALCAYSQEMSGETCKCIHFMYESQFNDSFDKEITFDQFMAEYGDKPAKERHPHADCIIAWANGEAVQVQHAGEWLDLHINESPSFDKYVQYRIKPDAPVIEEVEYSLPELLIGADRFKGYKVSLDKNVRVKFVDGVITEINTVNPA